MTKLNIPLSVFGLIGKRLDYSFSKSYFTKKFENLKLADHVYRNFELESEDDLLRFRESIIYNPHTATTQGKHEIIRGLNVTIPYKKEVLKVVDHISDEARQIGAFNTITIEDNIWTGHNTDAHGFLMSLKKFKNLGKNALILGTGGASNAVAYALESVGIGYLKVSRNPTDDDYIINYQAVNKDVLNQVTLIINTTPLGTYPAQLERPALPYEHLNASHILYDLVYNPQRTYFMKSGAAQGAQVTNGYDMLVNQAQLAWELWNK